MSRIKEVKIKNTIYPNMGIGVYGDDNREIRVKGAIEGQEVRALTTRNRKDYREARLYEVIEKSNLETEEGCIHKESCGGCVYQSLSYENELNYKLKQIKNLSNTISDKAREIIPSPVHRTYRNKMEYTFGDEYKGSPLALGMHKKNRFYEIVNTFECQIVHEDFNIIQESVRDYFIERGLSHYHKRTKEGNLRHLVVRRSQLGEILLNLVITHDTEIDKEDFIGFLENLELEGKIKSIYFTYNDSVADAVIAEKVEHIYGSEYIYEDLYGLKFKIGPFSFFQTNTKSAEVLYREALNMLGDLSGKTVLDLYSGTGTITQLMARKADKAIGIELVEEAVESAKKSSVNNNIKNTEFIQGDVLVELDKIKIKPDIIVMDPPREGIHPKSIEKIINLGADKFLYVSCNPRTMVKDIEVFLDNSYKILDFKLVDQFPRTAHVEAIALMTR